jgi:23S rRNA pseudouridine1911/1915/1917 synthase
MSEEIDTLIVTKEFIGMRLDQFLFSSFQKLSFIHSRTYFQYLIKEGHVLVNGEKVKKGYRVEENEEIAVEFIPTPEISLEPENIPLDILFEDEHLIIINKPCGLVVHPACGNWNHTLVNGLLYYLKNLPQNVPGNLRPGIVHRLDKDTTGIILVAKTIQAQKLLVDAFQKRKIKKNYLAITHGKPPTGLYSAPIARHSILRQQMSVNSAGKEAITEFMILSEKNPFYLVKACPQTGRTHQIRVHLKALNAPVLGDNLYGIKKINEEMNLHHQLLHAYQIAFDHPITSKPMLITAPLPQEFQKTLHKLDLQNNFMN